METTRVYRGNVREFYGLTDKLASWRPSKLALASLQATALWRRDWNVLDYYRRDGLGKKPHSLRIRCCGI